MILILIAGLSPPTWGAQITSYKIISDISGTSVAESIFITVENTGQTQLSAATISVPAGYVVQDISDTYGNLDYEVSGQGIKEIAFAFTTPLEPFEERLIILKLASDALVTKKEGYYEYLLVFTPRSDIPAFEHVLTLPEGANLFSPAASFEMVVPPTNMSPLHDKPTLIWGMAIGANEPTVFLVRYKVDEGAGVLRWVLVWALGGFVLGLVAYISGRKMKQRLAMKKVIASLKILNERERAVMEVVAKREGIKQTYLLEELGYTKASLSKILTKLEGRELIRKEKHGKINRLYLGRKVK